MQDKRVETMVFRISDIPEETKALKPWMYTLIRKPSKKVNEIDESIIPIIYKMMKTCLKHDGIGLSACQVGLFKKLFIIRVLDENGLPTDEFKAYFNLTYTPLKEEGISQKQEGCLSVPNYNYKVSRHNAIVASWYTIDNQEYKLVHKQETISGYLAQVMQHEHDHTLGISIADLGYKFITR